MKAHPAAEIFPMLTSLDMANLARSIKENGQRDPIVLHEGLILDGRNRWRACEINGVKPWTIEWDGKGSPTAYVIDKNLHRRQLDETQRALVAARAVEMFEAEGKENQRAGGRDKGRANLHYPAKSAEKAAELLNVSPRSVANGKRVIDKGVPELVEAVERGEVSVSAAAEVAHSDRASIATSTQERHEVSGQRAARRHEATTRYERAAGFVLIESFMREQESKGRAARNRSFRRRGPVGVAAYRTPARPSVTRRAP